MTVTEQRWRYRSLEETNIFFGRGIETSVFALTDMLRAAEYLKKRTSFSLSFFFSLQTRATSTLAKMTTVAQMFYLMFQASRASGRERVIQRERGRGTEGKQRK